MSAAALRWAAAALLAVCGFCAGDARRQKLARRRRTLEQTIAMLTRLRQEIAYRRTDLGQLYRTLAAEYSPGDSLGQAMKKAECFAGMQPPADLSLEEAACFAVCFGQLGRTDAGRACAQLDYYLRRFGMFLEKAREEERLSTSMDRRLGLAAGAILGLLVL